MCEGGGERGVGSWEGFWGWGSQGGKQTHRADKSSSCVRVQCSARTLMPGARRKKSPHSSSTLPSTPYTCAQPAGSGGPA